LMTSTARACGLRCRACCGHWTRCGHSPLSAAATAAGPLTARLLWYLTEICSRLDIRLEDVAARNIAKIADGMSRGVLGGEGDHR
jgi:hypothetical protein